MKAQIKRLLNRKEAPQTGAAEIFTPIQMRKKLAEVCRSVAKKNIAIGEQLKGHVLAGTDTGSMWIKYSESTFERDYYTQLLKENINESTN